MTFLRTFALAASLAVLGGTALAHDYTLGSLKIGHPWSRATPKSAPVGGGYMVITNSGTADDRLMSVTAPVCDKVELHEMSVIDGIMRMKTLDRGIVVPAGGSVAFKPGGYHVMFIGLKGSLEAGRAFKGTLAFEKAGTVEVEFQVEGMSAKPMDHSGMKPMGH